MDTTVHPALAPIVVNDIFTKISPGDRDYFRQSRESRGLRTSRPDGTSFAPRCKRSRADLEATLAGQDYFFGVFNYADICLFGTLTRVSRVSDEPLFDAAADLRAWWERMQTCFPI